jgi:hypothetical protein
MKLYKPQNITVKIGDETYNLLDVRKYQVGKSRAEPERPALTRRNLSIEVGFELTRGELCKLLAMCVQPANTNR